jgi:hypothetical protein
MHTTCKNEAEIKDKCIYSRNKTVYIKQANSGTAAHLLCLVTLSLSVTSLSEHQSLDSGKEDGGLL